MADEPSTPKPKAFQIQNKQNTSIDKLRNHRIKLITDLTPELKVGIDENNFLYIDYHNFYSSANRKQP
jgi:hypothetical protein